MLPLWTRETNFMYKGPTPDIGDLPCKREPGATYSVWDFSPEEREAIAKGALLRLGIYGARPIPPVSLQILGNEGTIEVLKAAEGIAP